MRRRTLLAGSAALLTLPALPARAAEFEVQMLNRSDAGTMVFEPILTRVAVGDTVKFVPTNPGHNAETIPGMLPDGAEPIKGSLGKEVDVTFTVPGVYGIKCMPHFNMGMTALVVVGDGPPANLDDAMNAMLPPLAKKRLDPVFAEIVASLEKPA
jgi:pseudoazurin